MNSSGETTCTHAYCLKYQEAYLLRLDIARSRIRDLLLQPGNSSSLFIYIFFIPFRFELRLIITFMNWCDIVN